MNGAIENFSKMLVEFRELSQKGSDADPKKFNSIAKSLLWDLKSSFSLPLSSDQLDFIKILTTTDASGDYWKGYGDALTDFLLVLNRLEATGLHPVDSNSVVASSKPPLVTEMPKPEQVAQPIAQPELTSSPVANTSQSKKKIILD